MHTDTDAELHTHGSGVDFRKNKLIRGVPSGMTGIGTVVTNIIVDVRVFAVQIRWRTDGEMYFTATDGSVNIWCQIRYSYTYEKFKLNYISRCHEDANA